MPAYMVDLDHDCSQGGCQKRAQVQVRNASNGTIGDYCRPHGAQLVKRLNDDAKVAAR